MQKNLRGMIYPHRFFESYVKRLSFIHLIFHHPLMPFHCHLMYLHFPCQVSHIPCHLLHHHLTAQRLLLHRHLRLHHQNHHRNLLQNLPDNPVQRNDILQRSRRNTKERKIRLQSPHLSLKGRFRRIF